MDKKSVTIFLSTNIQSMRAQYRNEHRISNAFSSYTSRKSKRFWQLNSQIVFRQWIFLQRRDTSSNIQNISSMMGKKEGRDMQKRCSNINLYCIVSYQEWKGGRRPYSSVSMGIRTSEWKKRSKLEWKQTAKALQRVQYEAGEREY